MLNYLYIALALALAVYVATLPKDSKDSTPSAPVAESVEGQGPSAVACAACVVGGIGLALSGWGAVLAAAFTQGSALVAAGCVAACNDALR